VVEFKKIIYIILRGISTLAIENRTDII